MAWNLFRKTRRLDKVASSSSLSDAELRVEDAPSSLLKSGTASATTNPVNKSTVSFTDVEVRHYKLIVGDNPFVEVPLSLDWDYDESQLVSVDEFEERHSRDDYIHAQDMEPLDLSVRQVILRGVGYSNMQIRAEERRRRVILLMEWAYRHNREEPCVYSCANGPVLFRRYIM